MTIAMQSAKTISSAGGANGPGDASAKSAQQQPGSATSEPAFDLLLAMLQSSSLPQTTGHPALTTTAGTEAVKSAVKSSPAKAKANGMTNRTIQPGSSHSQTKPRHIMSQLSNSAALSVASTGYAVTGKLPPKDSGGISSPARTSVQFGGNVPQQARSMSKSATHVSPQEPLAVQGAGTQAPSAAVAPGMQAPLAAVAPVTQGLPERFTRLLQSVGVPERDIKSLSSTGAATALPVSQHSIAHTMTRVQNSGKALSRPFTQTNSPSNVPKKQVHAPTTNVTATVNTSVPSTAQAGQGITPEVVWNANAHDASRQFAQLLAKHGQQSEVPQTLTVQVHPQGMGTLTVTVAQHDAGLNVQIQASSMQTASWLQTETSRLTQAVEAAGLPVNNVQVSVSTGQGQQQRGQGYGDGGKRVTAITHRRTAASSEVFQLEPAGLDGTAQSISLRA